MSYLGSTPASQFFAPGTDTFSGDGTTVAFTLSRNVATVNDILVVVNNVDQQPTAYTVSVSTLTFTAAPSSGTNNIYVRYLSTNITAIVPSASGTANSTTFLRGDNTWAVVSVTPTAVSDQLNASTGYFSLPSGTTAQRPVSPANGMIRFNTTNSEYEVYDTGSWRALTDQAGGINIDYLVVAGGGAGGFSAPGGGGAGGFRTGTASLQTSTAYTVTVGAGGATPSPSAGYGGNGSNSVFSSITSTGGGGGGYSANAGRNGGSGGGGGQNTSGFGSGNTPSTSPSQGNNGGGNNGGGGGASQAGATGYGAGGTQSGKGGDGTASSITGSSVTYAGGGAGYSRVSGGGALTASGGAGGGGNTNASGTANTGGGGGADGGNGGSGVVILKIPDTSTATFSGGVTSSLSTAVSGYKIYTITATSTTSETVTFS